MEAAALWWFLPIGYATTIAIETPVLLVALSRGHGRGRRLFAGAWLTACTYPLVVLVLPPLLAARSWTLYLVVAEILAPVAECALFAAAFHRGGTPPGRDRVRDHLAIIAANLASFAVGQLLERWHGA